MAVPTIALYASPPGNVCSTPPHPCVPSSSDYDFNSRPCSSSSPASTQRSLGGLSCLFSANSAMRHAASTSYSGGGGVEEFNSIWHDRGDELSSSYSYSSSIKCCSSRDQSPVSVFQGPVSSTSLGITSSSSSSSRSSPMKISHSAAANSHHHSFTSIWPSRQGLLNGFVRNALGSFIDNDSVPLHRAGIQGDSSAAVFDEFTFNMEESFAQENWTRQPCAKKLLFAAQSKHKIFHDEVIVKAFYEAEKAHRGQMRASGDPYLQHCVQTAILLAAIGANCTVVAAGLLHDTLDDSFTSYDYILKTFGGGVADLVEGVSKLSHLSKLARENNTASKTTEADRLHTMFLAMADARAVLIKLADRLHNMMTLGALPLVKQQRFAKETMEIFVPLANRLGISTWKEQLESLCFKYLNPDQHEKLSSKLEKSFNEARITSAKENLEQALKDGAVSYHVLSGRHKSLYSIYCKMIKYAPYAVPVLIVLLHLMSLLQWSVTSNRKNLTMDQIHDIHGLRLIVENEEDCYSALKVVHQLWPEAPGKFKDYIQHPKLNGYQSLHTVVMGEDMAPLEIQIRTKDMHLQAEFGFAAHWRYKEGDCTYSSFVLQMVEWARWVVTWQCEAMSKDSISSIGNGGSIRPLCPFPWHSDDCPYSYTPQSDHNGPVYVVLIENEKMSVQEFPPHATVMDLLEKVGRGSSRWSHYRFPLKQELRPTLNHEPVNDPHRKLKMGDVVHLTPSIPDESLSQYREEIQRMYDRGLTRSGATQGASLA